ncbi:MAG: hypothetical protein CMF98_06235 [Candidatus Marinimicrobia bacterium]|nr:hypothetical protein [Candidatus Neomarinimicrobiota bacterium]RPG13259.1 MAG: hypothetical protein CBD92_000035 [Pelagibacteraceae bacterium TMED232]|tara:strand:- start:1497 stop:2267 length:771 start_codon:yes stop_codon:yes gene_type:complete
MKYRILFLGQKPLGEKCYSLLFKSQSKNIKIKTVVSNKKKSNWWKSNYIYESSKKNNIKFISNEKRNENQIIHLIKENKINLIISVQHCWIFSDKILKIINENAYNLHNAKLPDYKGYNTINHAILKNDSTYSSTIHKIDKKVDSGDIVFEKSCEINEDETALSLHKKSLELSILIFKEFIEFLKGKKKIYPVKINEEGKFYSKNSLDNHRMIKEIDNIIEIDRKARAFYFPPFEPAYFMIKKRKFHVLPDLSEKF